MSCSILQLLKPKCSIRDPSIIQLSTIFNFICAKTFFTDFNLLYYYCVYRMSQASRREGVFDGFWHETHTSIMRNYQPVIATFIPDSQNVIRAVLYGCVRIGVTFYTSDQIRNSGGHTKSPNWNSVLTMYTYYVLDRCNRINWSVILLLISSLNNLWKGITRSISGPCSCF